MNPSGSILRCSTLYSEATVIPTTVLLIRSIQTVLVSITNVGVVNAAVVGTQEVVRGTRGDGRICQSYTG